jgi:hypothetical protein
MKSTQLNYRLGSNSRYALRLQTCRNTRQGFCACESAASAAVAQSKRSAQV